MLTALGWDASLAAAYASACSSLRGGSSAPDGVQLAPARVARVDRGASEVLTAQGPLRVEHAAAVLEAGRIDPTTAPCVGDWAVVRGGEVPRLVALLTRRTAFVRLGSAPGTSAGQVLAANVDVALVVEPLDPQPHPGRVERLLALAWESGARPLVVLTKADLVPDAEALRDEVAAAAPGVDVVLASSWTGKGLDVVAAYATPGTTLALLGPSGAGKSSLLNALSGGDVARTGATRADGKGRHTTVSRELVRLPGGATLIDTPGLRGIGVVAGEQALEQAFADVAALARRCRFADCGHGVEPGCAVLEAVEAGELPERRLHSWRKLEREARWVARRQDARAQAQERNRWKAVHKEMRRSGRARP
ncbi:ribosome small subunit-dependent GTPase A [Motilibacter deserti]|uniref:Small ribosomal subunit biogenesis GTPase RsgA n=1 Tax=Motilibacter deserti TaxID=2714956 RepID=A0ABX0GST3_9ACTN|nr:ribosome small subunit-dependent GTPase A [Motilibacter deserti]